MSIKGNVVKGWITSVIGTLLMTAALFLWFFGVIPLMWEGVVAMVLGAILLLAPKSIEDNVKSVINKWSGNTNKSSTYQPYIPEDNSVNNQGGDI